MSSENESNPQGIQYKQGDFCHVEIPVKDKERAMSFYGEVFGWKFHDIPEMQYTLFTTPGGVIGGGLFSPNERMPDKIINFLTVTSIDSTVARIEQFGGKSVSPKIEIPGEGTLLHLLDSEGNLIALWEPSEKK